MQKSSSLFIPAGLNRLEICMLRDYIYSTKHKYRIQNFKDNPELTIEKLGH